MEWTRVGWIPAVGLTVMLAGVDAKTAAAEELGAPVVDNAVHTFVLADRLEYRWNAGEDRLLWDVQGWIGRDYQKLWIKTEGETLRRGPMGVAEIQVLYSRAIAEFWDLQAGWRYDPRPSPSRNFLVVGAQGLAPYWFDVDATAFISDHGDLSARLEAKYDLLLTQRLIAQPRVETNLAAQRVDELGIGRGVNTIEIGLRLRYEVRREFAPYVGVSVTRVLGETANLARGRGADADVSSVVAGIRAWF
ncbi:MAG: copper resistance protein B [Nitrospiria bacterium]